MSVKVKDNGLENYKKAFKTLQSKKIVVGLFRNVGKDILTKAIANEFGAKTRNGAIIPERSFLRSTYNNNVKLVRERFKKIVKNISKSNASVKQKLEKIGEEQKLKVKETIVRLRSPPNAPMTIRKKKSDNPLIDTGEMRIRISSELRKK